MLSPNADSSSLPYSLKPEKMVGVSPKIAPSMLSSDFANLAAEAKRMIDLGANWLHMDIMVTTFIASSSSPNLNFLISLNIFTYLVL